MDDEQRDSLDGEYIRGSHDQELWTLVHHNRPAEIKVLIVSKSLRPGAMVHEVAERHGLKPNHLLT